jgi:Glycosyl transferase family 2
MAPQYKLCVGAIFKNEGHILKEWIDHYLFHGVEHFYLINDQSSDNYAEILEPYIQRNQVTLNSPIWDHYVGRQFQMYNQFILPHLNTTEWLLMVDLDEFMWSPQSINLYDVLKHITNVGQIQVEHTLFGSSGHIEQPKSVVKSFLRRSSDSPTANPGLRKYFVNSAFAFSDLTIHHAIFKNPEHEKNNFILLNAPYFVLNHYNCQSMNFWKYIKCTRGDADEYKVRDMALFETLDLNDVEDTRLRDQNATMILTGQRKALCLLCRTPKTIWMDFLKTFKHYDVYMLIDDNNYNIHQVQQSYPTIRFLQIDNELCRLLGYKDSNTAVYPAYVTIAWDKAIYYFSETETSYPYIWFIEDDVFFHNAQTLHNLDQQYPTSDILMAPVTDRSWDAQQPWDWHWCNIPFDDTLVKYENLARGMVCASRMSKRMMECCATYAQDNIQRKLMYIESLFPSLARQNNLQLDTPTELSTIQWNTNWAAPTHTITPGFCYHPVKDIQLHETWRSKA